MSTNAVALMRTPAVLSYWQPGPPDEHNDPTDSWETLDVLCTVQMRTRQESDDSGQLSQTTYIALFPPDIQIPRSIDTLTVNGETLHFRGDSWLASGTRGDVDHIEATLVRAE